tara:strand:- start:78 stop:296 length:219 start_codon:yes stop_codon:yes gene_type:complete
MDEQKAYDDIFEHVMHMLNDHQLPVEMIAGCLMAIAQRLYRTHLTPEEYKRIMDLARFTEVEPYEVKKERLH